MMKAILLFAGLVLVAFKPYAQPTVTDYDGNVYNTVTIGTQVWMQENLKTAHYQNGNAIPNVSDNTAWGNLITGGRCYYNNDSVANAPVYGVLYNWFAVNDSRNLCPTNWHVPTDAEWTALSDYLGGTSVAGGKMKEIGNNHWLTPNVGATNESGFSALPGGYRPHDNGIFEDIGAFGYWWSSTEFNSNSAWDRNIYHASANIYPYYDDGKAYGFSIRCLRNSPANLNNELKNNRTIKIYPNPAIDRVYIDYTETKKITMQVYNIIGECVLQSELMDGINEIDVGKLSKGIYVIQIIGDTWKTQRKLTKE